MTTATKTAPNSNSQIGAPSSVSAEIDGLKSDVAQLTADVRNVGAALVEKGREVAATGYDEASQRFDSSVETCTRMVEERPLASVLVALGAGVVIGKFFLGRN